MAAWQSGTHGEAAGTLACTGPSVAASALRFAGTHRNTDNDIRLSHLCDGSWIPADTAGKRPGAGKKKNQLLRPASTELLMPLNNDPGTAAKTTSVMVARRLRPKAFTRRSVSLAPFKQQREAHNSTTFHTKSATVVKSISHYL